MRILIVVLVLLSSFTSLAQEYVSGKVLFKIKAEYREKCNKSSVDIRAIQELVQSFGSLEKSFPTHTFQKQKDIYNRDFVDLSTMYELSFSADISPYNIIRLLKKIDAIDYAEPRFIDQLCYDPNDSMNANQYYLDAIHAYEAWDLSKSDSSVVIAIVDTGSDTDHVDLKGNFAYNLQDPINGIDDDNDGYIDNYYGWNVANNNNNVNFNLIGHGTNVAGIASASTDNLHGISGCGFNSRILTVRIDDQNTGSLTNTYEGIVYAADHGAFIINNSWGSYSYSQFNEDIVNYAAINKGCLLIGGAGNDAKEDRFYLSLIHI